MSTFSISAHFQCFLLRCKNLYFDKSIPRTDAVLTYSDPKPIKSFVVQPSCLEFYLFNSPLGPIYNPYYKLHSFLQQAPEKHELLQNIGKHRRSVRTQ